MSHAGYIADVKILGSDGPCVMEDMGDDDGTGHDPLVERIESLAGCSVVFTLGL